MIDTVDSTNMKQLLGKNYYVIMAERIRENALEENIKAGAAIGDKFRKIAEVPIPSKKRKRKENYNLFIFLSKYITRTNEYGYGGNAYSIMDSVVKRYLPLYRHHFLGRGNTELADRLTAKNLQKLHESFDFDGYCRLLGEIADAIGGISRVMLDHFLWFSFKQEAREDETGA